MSLWRSLAALRRNWLTGLFAGFVVVILGMPAVHADPSYAVSATVVLQRFGAPQISVDPSRNLVVTGELLAESIVADGERGRLGSRRNGVSYRVNLAAYDANLESSGRLYGPLLEVAVFGSSRAKTARGLEEVLAAVDARLLRIQAQVNAPTDSYVIAHRFTPTGEPVPVYGSGKRALLALTVLALWAALAAAAAADSLRAARRSAIKRSPGHLRGYSRSASLVPSRTSR